MGSNSVRILKSVGKGESVSHLSERVLEQLPGKTVVKNVKKVFGITVPKLKIQKLPQGLAERKGASEAELKAYSEACSVIEKFRIKTGNVGKKIKTSEGMASVPHPEISQNPGKKVLENNLAEREIKELPDKSEYIEEVHGKRTSLEQGTKSKQKNISSESREGFADTENVAERDLKNEAVDVKKTDVKPDEIKTATQKERPSESEGLNVKREETQISKKTEQTSVKKEETSLAKKNENELKVDEKTSSNSANSRKDAKNSVETEKGTTSVTKEKVEPKETGKKPADKTPEVKKNTERSVETKKGKVSEKKEKSQSGKTEIKTSDKAPEAKNNTGHSVENKKGKTSAAKEKSQPKETGKKPSERSSNVKKEAGSNSKPSTKTETASSLKNKTEVKKTEKGTKASGTQKSSKSSGNTFLNGKPAGKNVNILSSADNQIRQNSKFKNKSLNVNIFASGKNQISGAQPVQTVKQTISKIVTSINNFAQDTNNAIVQRLGAVRNVYDREITRVKTAFTEALPKQVAKNETSVAKNVSQEVKSPINAKIKTTGAKAVELNGNISAIEDVAKKNTKIDLKTNNIPASNLQKSPETPAKSVITENKPVSGVNTASHENVSPVISSKKPSAFKSQESEIPEIIKPGEIQSAGRQRNVQNAEDGLNVAKTTETTGEKATGTPEIKNEAKGTFEAELKQTDTNLKKTAEPLGEEVSQTENTVSEAFNPENMKKEFLSERVQSETVRQETVPVSNITKPEVSKTCEAQEQKVTPANIFQEKSQPENIVQTANIGRKADIPQQKPSVTVAETNITNEMPLSKGQNTQTATENPVKNHPVSDVSAPTVRETSVTPEDFKNAVSVPNNGDVAKTDISEVLEQRLPENAGISENIHKNLAKTVPVRDVKIPEDTGNVELPITQKPAASSVVRGQTVTEPVQKTQNVKPQEFEGFNNRSVKDGATAKIDADTETVVPEAIYDFQAEAPVNNPLRRQLSNVKSTESASRFSFGEQKTGVTSSIQKEETPNIINLAENPTVHTKQSGSTMIYKTDENAGKAAELPKTGNRPDANQGVHSSQPSKQEEFIAVSNAVPVKGESTESKVIKKSGNDAITAAENDGKGSGNSGGQNGGGSGGQQSGQQTGQKSGQGSGKNRD